MTEAAAASTRPIVCLSHLRWDFVFQRPQHLMSRFAAAGSVIFVEEPLEGPTSGLDSRTTAEGVTVLVPRLPARGSQDESDTVLESLLNDYLERHEIADYVLWYLTPMALRFTRSLKPRAVAYDCMDELSAFAGAPRELVELEAELLRRSDVVFTGGRSLYEAKRGRHDNVHLFPSSVDLEHFFRARLECDEPVDQAHLGRPRIGYFGVIDERLDLELLAAVADARPAWQLVMVGPRAKIDERDVPRRPNISYLGMKSYDELPSYLAGWDVAMLPFALNAATEHISPTKTPEYLAGGKPVVSTPVRDVVDPYGIEGLIEIASTSEEFVAAIERWLSEGMTETLPAVDAFLAGMSWDRTYERMAQLVEESARIPSQRRAGRPTHFDFLVVGAGFGGSVLAERLATQAGKRVLLVDKRPHIGGNAYDRYDEAGVLVHTYGPHIFHTNSAEVFSYLSQFTAWRPYEHRVRASVDGMLVPIPINLDTINALYGTSYDSNDLQAFFASVAERNGTPRTSEDVVVSAVSRELYEKFFRNYTRKQWGLDPSELDASVTARVPTRTNRDDRYFGDRFQAMPLHGYTRMFERMLDQPNLHIMLATDFRELEGLVPYEQLVYTGPIDEYFHHAYGVLPYRSLQFEFVTHDREVFQPVPVVNFPNEHAYTRCTEFKYLTGQAHPKTTVVYEYPTSSGDPYYPIPRPENNDLYKRYKLLADAVPDVHFVGRLATYRYYNMDQVVAQALATFKRIVEPGGVVPTTGLLNAA